MAHVVTDKCVKCKYTDCVEFCPVDCFVELPDMLVINPETCIDCGLCVQSCPVEAIISDIYDHNNVWTLYNKNKVQEGHPLSQKKAPLDQADYFAKIKDKKHLIPDLP